MEEVLALKWFTLVLMMKKMNHYDKMSNPIGLFDWSEIGLEKILPTASSYDWHFKVINKNKLVHAMIKYNLNLTETI